MMRKKTERLTRRIVDWGADLVGVADLSRNDVRTALSEEFRHFTRAISMAIYLPPGNSNRKLVSKDDKHKRILSYMNQSGDAINRLNRILRALEREFKMRRHKFFSLPPVHNAQERSFASCLYKLFPHRTAATSAGLGWIGKNGMLLNRRYGPNLIWATILTNAPLTASEDICIEGQCDNCGICQSVCPASAIKGINWRRDMGNNELVNLQACSDYMEANSVRYGLPVCGICFLSCPVGAHVAIERTTHENRAASGG